MHFKVQVDTIFIIRTELLFRTVSCFQRYICYSLNCVRSLSHSPNFPSRSLSSLRECVSCGLLSDWSALWFVRCLIGLLPSGETRIGRRSSTSGREESDEKSDSVLRIGSFKLCFSMNWLTTIHWFWYGSDTPLPIPASQHGM